MVDTVRRPCFKYEDIQEAFKFADGLFYFNPHGSCVVRVLSPIPIQHPHLYFLSPPSAPPSRIAGSLRALGVGAWGTKSEGAVW